MFGTFDHVGYLVRDVDEAVAEAQRVFGLPVARVADLDRFSIRATFLGEGSGTLELFTFTDPQLLEPRLDGADRRLDHVAFRVTDIDAIAAAMRAAGARFCGPDRREEAFEPIPTGPSRALWSMPQTTMGLAIQLIQP
jgi:methylmalonyl-CoA/ethylmalonyl-CoA epimerase